MICPEYSAKELDLLYPCKDLLSSVGMISNTREQDLCLNPMFKTLMSHLSPFFCFLCTCNIPHCSYFWLQKLSLILSDDSMLSLRVVDFNSYFCHLLCWNIKIFLHFYWYFYFACFNPTEWISISRTRVWLTMNV